MVVRIRSRCHILVRPITIIRCVANRTNLTHRIRIRNCRTLVMIIIRIRNTLTIICNIGTIVIRVCSVVVIVFACVFLLFDV